MGHMINWDDQTKDWVNQKLKNNSIIIRSSKQPVMYRKLNFDEEKLLAKDFLNLRYNDKFKVILQKNAQNEELNNLKTFSDFIVRINPPTKREKLIIAITSFNIYILNNLKKLDLVQVIQLTSIKAIVFHENSSNHCTVQLTNGVEYVIEIFRRIDFNLFIQEQF